MFLAISCKDKIQKDASSANDVLRLINIAHEKSDQRDSVKKYLDSAYKQLPERVNDTLTRYLYANTAMNYYQYNFFDNAIKSNAKLIKLSSDVKDTLNLARASYIMGVSFYGKAKNDSAFYYYDQAEKFYQTLNHKSRQGEIILYKAYIYYSVGEYLLSETEAIRAQRILEKQDGSGVHVYNCYNLIATSLEGQNNYEEAIKYYELAYEYIEQLKKEGLTDAEAERYKASCYNNMGQVYANMGQHTKAIELYDEALKLEGLKEQDPSLYAKLLNIKATSKLKKRDLAGLPGLFYTSLKIRDSIKNKSGVVASNIDLAEYFVYKRDTARAINYLKRAYYGAKEIKSHSDILESLKMLWVLDKENAPAYSKRWLSVNDSLQLISKKNKDKFARIEYETDKLEWEKDELLKKNSLIIGIFAAILLLGVSIFVIYYLNARNKKLLLIQEQQKANEEIYELMFEQQTKIDKAREEEKGRIAMELHDGILNNIYAVRLNLEFINKKSDDQSIAQRKDYIKQLQNVETEIRGVSHDLNRNVLFHEKSFKDLLESTILTQKNKFNTSFEADIDPTIDWDEMTNIQKINLYRIIQESLQNINKYSQAKNAVVVITKEKEGVKAVITDDGVGFDPEKGKGGIGIKNFRKRAAAINGKINIVSALGEGAKIELVFPN